MEPGLPLGAQRFTMLARALDVVINALHEWVVGYRLEAEILERAGGKLAWLAPGLVVAWENDHRRPRVSSGKTERLSGHRETVRVQSIRGALERRAAASLGVAGHD